MFKVSGGSHEETPHIHGKEKQLHFDEEIPHVQSKRNTSKTVGAEKDIRGQPD